MMGRRQRGIRVLWRLVWERDRYHPLTARTSKKIKRQANQHWRQDMKRELASLLEEI